MERELREQAAANRYLSTVPVGHEEKDSEETHLVVSVVYGAEAHCVLSQNLEGNGEDEEVRKEAREYLSQVLNKLRAAIDCKPNVEKFKEEFSQEEKQQLTRLKCQLYSDFQSEPVRECNIFDVHTHILEVKSHIFKTNDQQIKNIKGVPIAIQLCSLENLFTYLTVGRQSTINKLYNYCDVDSYLVNSCCCILADLHRIVYRADAICATINKGSPDYECLRDFVTTVSEYRRSLKSNLRDLVVEYRDRLVCHKNDREMLDVAYKAEYHPLFRRSQLEQ